MRSVFGAALNRWKLSTETNSISLIMYGGVLGSPVELSVLFGPTECLDQPTR